MTTFEKSLVEIGFATNEDATQKSDEIKKDYLSGTPYGLVFTKRGIDIGLVHKIHDRILIERSVESEKKRIGEIIEEQKERPTTEKVKGSSSRPHYVTCPGCGTNYREGTNYNFDCANCGEHLSRSSSSLSTQSWLESFP